MRLREARYGAEETIGVDSAGILAEAGIAVEKALQLGEKQVVGAGRSAGDSLPDELDGRFDDRESEGRDPRVASGLSCWTVWEPIPKWPGMSSEAVTRQR